MKNALRQYNKLLKQLSKQREQLEKQLANSPLQKQIKEIDSILGGSNSHKTPPKAKANHAGGTVKQKLLEALKTGPKTANELQAATGAKFIRVQLAELQKTKQVTSNGKRPASFSLK